MLWARITSNSCSADPESAALNRCAPKVPLFLVLTLLLALPQTAFANRLSNLQAFVDRCVMQTNADDIVFGIDAPSQFEDIDIRPVPNSDLEKIRTATVLASIAANSYLGTFVKHGATRVLEGLLEDEEPQTRHRQRVSEQVGVHTELKNGSDEDVLRLKVFGNINGSAWWLADTIPAVWHSSSGSVNGIVCEVYGLSQADAHAYIDASGLVFVEQDTPVFTRYVAADAAAYYKTRRFLNSAFYAATGVMRKTHVHAARIEVLRFSEDQAASYGAAPAALIVSHLNRQR